MPQQQQDSTKVSAGDALGLIYLVAGSHLAAIVPFIRSDLGSEALGLKAVFAMVAMALLSEGRWWSGMGFYLIAWFIMIVYRRIETFKNWRSGNAAHSCYIGSPWLAMKIIKNPEKARNFEPFLCLLIGAPLYLISPTVGGFIMTGFITLPVCMGIEQFVVYKRLQGMNDAVVEGAFYSEEFRRRG